MTGCRRVLALTGLVPMILLALAAAGHAAPRTDILRPLRVDARGRFLVRDDGRPFFWLADTAWQLVHDLRQEEVERYLDDRRRKGFTVVMTVLLAEHGGLDQGNAYGHRPLQDRDPARPAAGPGPSYWDQVDFVVRRAAEKGLYLGLLPTWGKYVTKNFFDGKVDGIFDEENAFAYGRFLGDRYHRASHVVWVLGGDRHSPTPGAKAIWRAMARGIAVGVTGREEHAPVLMTYHPSGPGTSVDFFHEDGWLDFNGVQSSHGRAVETWKMIDAGYARSPTKPIIDLETTYEELPWNDVLPPGPDHVRRSAYWAVFAGAAGHTYGHNSIWQMYAPGKPAKAHATRPWYEALDAPGARQMIFVRRLFEARPFLTQSPAPDLLADDPGASTVRTLALAGDGYAMVYSPEGAPFTIRMRRLPAGRTRASWFDPRNGRERAIGVFPSKGDRRFHPPGITGLGNDWVLILTSQHPPGG